MASRLNAPILEQKGLWSRSLTVMEVLMACIRPAAAVRPAAAPLTPSPICPGLEGHAVSIERG